MRHWLVPLFAGMGVALASYQATLLATPFALMHLATSRVAKGVGSNRFIFAPMTTAANQTIVRPSPDLSYSLCVFDVSQGPVLIHAEPIPDHYWSVSVFDARTDVAAVVGDRDTGGKPAMLTVLRRGQIAPVGWQPVPVDYNRGVALIRILLHDPSEYSAIDTLRRKSSCSVQK